MRGQYFSDMVPYRNLSYFIFTKLLLLPSITFWFFSFFSLFTFFTFLFLFFYYFLLFTFLFFLTLLLFLQYLILIFFMLLLFLLFFRFIRSFRLTNIVKYKCICIFLPFDDLSVTFYVHLFSQIQQCLVKGFFMDFSILFHRYFLTWGLILSIIDLIFLLVTDNSFATLLGLFLVLTICFLLILFWALFPYIITIFLWFLSLLFFFG